MEQLVESAANVHIELEPSPNCSCGEPSEYGCHGIRNGEVYSEYLCQKCKHKGE